MRIIIVGPSASGKNLLKNRFINKGLIPSISYTSRIKRDNEIDGDDYFFITSENFKQKIDNNYFYEWACYDGDYYGTGLQQWENANIFIMEPDGISNIKKEHLIDCFIVYLHIDEIPRKHRMEKERKWNNIKIKKRIKQDNLKFSNFNTYDLIIKNQIF